MQPSKKSLILALGIAASSIAFATPDVAIDVQHLHVNLPRESAETTAAACQTLGMLFSGPDGYGIFDTFDCGKALSPPQPDHLAWTFRVRRSKAGLVDARIELQTPSETVSIRRTQVVAAASFDSKEEPLAELLADPDFAEVLVWTLLDQMPFIVKIKSDQSTAPSLIPARHRVNRYVKLPEPATTIYLFTLKIEAKTNIWRSELLGKGRLTTPKGAGRVAQRKNDLAWETDLSGKNLPNELPLFAHAATETRLVANDYRTLIEDAIKARAELGVQPVSGAGFLKSVAPGRATFFQTAMGVSIVDPETILLPKMRRVLGAAQARAGIWRGLSAEFDVLPKEKEEFEAKTYVLSWNRFASGWTFAYSPSWCPSWLLDRLDLTPRLGMWQMDAVLPAKDTDGHSVAVDYGFKAQFDAGFNVGAEMAWPLGLGARLWHARDVTSGLLVAGGAPGASSSRFGGDLYVRGPALPRGFAPSRLYFLFFYLTETAKFSPEQKQELSLLNPEGPSGSGSLHEVQFDVAYAGVGVGGVF